MSNADDSLHVYRREITTDTRSADSLSVIAGLIETGQSLLDLGMGTGGLGKYLSQRQTVVADGVTLNPAEADIARTWYRQAVVADLDRDDLGTLFGKSQYDCIVCADVLEHLKAPQRTLEQCKALLKPGGRLLTSVPNAGYCGLVAELIEGEFRYRSEGLLDNTHLRFFTRASLLRFFAENGWVTSTVQTIQRGLHDSEFRVAFDKLPPSVARHLLAIPDALTYQFISVLKAEPTSDIQEVQLASAPLLDGAANASAIFSAQLYLATDNQYSEATKLVAPGRIGEARQVLAFEIPASIQPYTKIRLDPADRPGFFRLHQAHLRLADGTLAWKWDAGQDSLSALINAPQQQIVVSAPWEMSAGALLMLYGDDPWMELPISAEVLQKVSASGARLDICAGWPMSADYLQASLAINTLQMTYQQAALARQESHQEEVGRLRLQHAQTESQQRGHLESIQQQLQAELEKSKRSLEEAEQAKLRLALVLDETKLRLATELQAARKQTESERLRLTAAMQAAESQSMTDKQRIVSDLEAHALSERQRLSAELQAVQQEMQAGKQQLLAELRTTQKDRNTALAQFNQIATHLDSVERSTLFRATRPLSHLKGRVDRLLGRGPNQNHGSEPGLTRQPVPVSKHPVDVIVPVYRGLEDTRRCLESVLAAPGATAWRLVVINDCSPEPDVTDWLRGFALRDKRIELLENPENLGFVGTVNRGMAMSRDNDVVLLNSDAEVANDWLDRIQRSAYSAQRIASVTPFSNNATICSYPRFCQANELPDGHDTASLDRLFAQHLSGQSVEVPTGVGFCMYIRRQCLQEIGLFDVANFGKGYGEENDFCIRAEEAGWTNLHALDVFVRHAGGISFGDSKSERELAAMQTLRRLHPGYESNVHAFVQRDPARAARLSIDLARITAADRPVILNIMHDREGGTLRHVQELAQRLGGQASFLRLSPTPGGAELKLEGAHEAFSVQFSLPQDQPRLLQTLRQLQVGHIHFHHVLGHSTDICDLPTQLGVTHDFTTHDYYTYCPQISLTDHTDQYCNERGIEQCRQCVQRNPAPGGEAIESWRERHASLLRQARYVISPSADAATRIQRFVPAARVQVVPHSTLDVALAVHPKPAPDLLAGNRPLKIVVLGALGRIKGADVLEEVATLAASQNLRLEFHLLGFAYRSLRTTPKANLTVHGAYQEKDLAQLLRSLQADAAWFPALWPETYSYTLSASLDSGLPIIAPNIGAFAERLQNRDWTWLCDWQQSAQAWTHFFDKIREENFCLGKGPQPITYQLSQTSPTATPRLDYYTNYLASVPRPDTISTQQVLALQQQITVDQQALGVSMATTAVKSATLRTVIKLRSNPALSVVVRLIPMHMQRRVKSWLVK